MCIALFVGAPLEYRERFSRTAADFGHDCVWVETLAQAHTALSQTRCDLLVVNERLLSAHNGWLDLFDGSGPLPHVVTIADSPPRGGEAAEQGALRRLSPEGMAELLGALPARPRESPAPESALAPSAFDIVGSSPNLLRAFEQAYRYAGSDASVLINGATGTGKELFAKALHKMSPRRDGPFVTVDCASLPEMLVESMLFGYMRGAFTGAGTNKDGLVKLANKGTLFLDEVGELNPGIQKKFLRVLQERRFRPVGGGAECVSDFRLIAATNRDLGQMVTDGLFREDLYYRLHILHIRIPSLAERREDVPLIARHLLDRLCEKRGVAPKRLSANLARCLSAYSWPGNVRELASTVESMFALAWDKPSLQLEHLPRPLYSRLLAELGEDDADDAPASLHRVLERRRNRSDRRCCGPEVTGAPGNGRAAVPAKREDAPGYFRESRQLVLDAFEKKYLENLYRESEADIQKACAISRLSRPRLYELYRKHKIQQCVSLW